MLLLMPCLPCHVCGAALCEVSRAGGWHSLRNANTQNTPPQVRRDLEQRPGEVNLQDEQYIRKASDRMQDVVRPGAGAG